MILKEIMKCSVYDLPTPYINKKKPIKQTNKKQKQKDNV